MKHPNRRSLAAAAIMIVLGALASCATVQVNPIPAPPPTAKLRVFVHAFTLDTTESGLKAWTVAWAIPHEEFARIQVRITEAFLERKGIYETVQEGDVRAAIGDQDLGYARMERNGWAQARVIGRALHADYVLFITRQKQRGLSGLDTILQNILINTETGRSFKAGYRYEAATLVDLADQRKLLREAYRTMFNAAKEDMLSLAIRKGRAYRPSSVPAPAVKPVEQPAGPVKNEEPPVVAKAVPAPSKPAGPGLIEEPKTDGGAKKIVVYDFDATDQYRTVALILAEALREEVFKLKQYVLVNREDLQKMLEEMALQQTGLIDEKDAVRTGKGLAANQVVTGRLGILGKTFVMQAKRVDVETFGTLGLASLKFTEGSEDEVLSKLPEFARGLVGLQQ